MLHCVKTCLCNARIQLHSRRGWGGVPAIDPREYATVRVSKVVFTRGNEAIVVLRSFHCLYNVGDELGRTTADRCAWQSVSKGGKKF